MLTLNHVGSGYRGRPVLLDVDLNLLDGSATAVLGRNGVGKTTLLKTVMGLIKTGRGSIRLDGNDITKLPTHWRATHGIAYVPQGRHVFGSLTVAQNLRVAAQAVFGRDWPRHVQESLEAYPQLSAKRDERAQTLSGGQQQILALARATITKPRLLLLDEPTEGIAPAVLEELATLIHTIQEERGVALLLAEQNLKFAAQLVDEAVILERGTVATRVPMDEVINSYSLQSRYLAL